MGWLLSKYKLVPSLSAVEAKVGLTASKERQGVLQKVQTAPHEQFVTNDM